MKAKDPKLSILMPLKNYSPAHLRRCVESILSQSYTNLELIIKHNGPNSEYENLQESFDDDRIITLSSPDDSLCQAGNQAFQRSSGDIITLFAHDDVYCQHALLVLMENIDDSMWYFGEINYHKHGMLLPHAYHNKTTPSLETMKIENPIPQPATFWRREASVEIGEFDENFTLCWDYDYWTRLIKKWKPKYIPYKFADYYLTESSASSTQYDRCLEEIEAVKRKHFPALRQNDE